ncbi:MAG: hypothetical protein IMZ52_07755 [Actinobacteria bacterium]|nr:hypothetical protein [Actinomycetota bacterium]
MIKQKQTTEILDELEAMKIFLEGIGFEEIDKKEGCWRKSDFKQDIYYFMYWDLRKDKPFFYVYQGGSDKPLPKEDFETFDEYKLFAERFHIEKENQNKQKKTDLPPSSASSGSPKQKIQPLGLKVGELTIKENEYMRGTEEKVTRLMDTKLQLDSIILASGDKTKPGEGLLWHELVFGKKIHKEPSVELVDMIAQDMGHITTKIVDFGKNTLEDPNTHKKYLTYYCVVEATDNITKTSGLGAAEQIIDFNEIEHNGRTFARTNAIRKAERNAKERMIPIPRRALVELIIRKLEEHQKSKKQNA